MKSELKRRIFVVSLILFFTVAVMNAQVKNSSADNTSYFSGYEKDIKGEVLGYHSPLASVNSSLLVRSIAKENYIEWETAAIPADYNEKFSKFVWMFGIQVQKEESKFDLFINDKYILSFRNPKDSVIKNWAITGADSVQLAFNSTMADKYGDLMGFASLKVPTSLYNNGAPLRIRVAGESLNKNFWYMTFRHSTKNNIRAFPLSVIVKADPANLQAAVVEIPYFGEPVKAAIKIMGKKYAVDLAKGFNKFNLSVPAVTYPQDTEITYEVNGNVEGKALLHLEPVKEITIYLLHHSHNDIGYTHVQSDVVKMQIKNLKDAVAAIERSKNYPENARMKWNSEVAWPVEQYLRNCTKSEIEKLKKAVREGSIEVNALYANMLTGLCRPEELMQVMEASRKICKEFGVPVKSAMISDVPGLSWGIVPVLAEYGIKYLQIGQNQGDRIGNTLSTWGDKPFYWVSPSGKDKILCFTAGQGYSFFHTGLNYKKIVNPLNEEKLSYYLEELKKEQYPYDIIPIHYTVGSDNGPVHQELPDVVKEWNEKYVSPKIIVSTTGSFFKVFDEKYGNQIPVVRGDYTGSWEDGAASTALETGMNRRAADQITQAEALYSIINRKGYPAQEFEEAWENVLLYSEHTWGSWNSMSDPENPFTKQQWAVKRTFALKADSISNALVSRVIPSAQDDADAIDVYNTNSWSRTGWVTLTTKPNMENTIIKDEKGKEVPFQVLKNGELVLFASNVPPLGSKRYFLEKRNSGTGPCLMSITHIIANDMVRVDVDPKSGNISSLTLKGVAHNFVDTTKPGGLTDYQYVNGRRPDKYETVSNVKIQIADYGLYITKLRVTSDAPGCNKLEKEITIYKGSPKVDITITVDRKKVYTPEGVHIAFPFNIPGAYDYINTAWANYRPEYEQIAGSCKNYFPVQRFVDVSNRELGITLIPIDAPMVEIGAIMTDGNVYGWKKNIENSPMVYSYIMNNYWGTNYKAEQEGVVKFSYTLIPHLRTDLAESEKNALEENQPLIAVPINKEAKQYKSLFELNSGKVITSSVKPSADGKGLIVRLYNTSMQPSDVSFRWGSFKPAKIFLSNPDEAALKQVGGAIKLSANEILTLKLEK